MGGERPPPKLPEPAPPCCTAALDHTLMVATAFLVVYVLYDVLALVWWLVSGGWFSSTIASQPHPLQPPLGVSTEQVRELEHALLVTSTTLALGISFTCGYAFARCLR